MTHDMNEEDFDRVPGLHGAFDIAQLLEKDKVFLIEAGGRTDEGQQLFMVFARRASGDGGPLR